MDRLIALLVAAPALVGAALWLGMLGTARVSGTHPLWDVQPRSLPEAAALRDAAAIVRFMNEGADPDQPGPVRAGIVGDEDAVMTALEAATARRDAEIVQLVVDEAARAAGRR